MVALLCEKITYCTRMEVLCKHEEVSCKLKCIIYRKGATHRTEIKWLFLTVKGFNTNLVHFLPWYHVIISNVHLCSFTCTISHVHRCASKTVLCAQNLVYKES